MATSLIGVHEDFFWALSVIFLGISLVDESADLREDTKLQNLTEGLQYAYTKPVVSILALIVGLFIPKLFLLKWKLSPNVFHSTPQCLVECCDCLQNW